MMAAAATIMRYAIAFSWSFIFHFFCDCQYTGGRSSSSCTTCVDWPCAST